MKRRNYLAILCLLTAWMLTCASCNDDNYSYDPQPSPSEKQETDPQQGSTKMVGYLAYDSFDLKSIEKLVQICKEFKAKGVTELILDLRYNGGGYVITEETLASMLVPPSVINSRQVYQRTVYNDYLTRNGRGEETLFKTLFYYPDLQMNYSTADANIGLEKIYLLTTQKTASASEGLAVGLSPYIDVEVIGTQTHGKFCTGQMVSINNFYEGKSNFTENNWGVYVMIGAFADKDGNNMARPNGITPAIEARDNPLEPFQLGDENEAMLKVALERAGKHQTTTKAEAPLPPSFEIKSLPSKYFGMRISTDHLLATDAAATRAQSDNEIKDATQFAADVMTYFYLWNEEVADKVALHLDPETCTDPIRGVEEVVHPEDRWSFMTEDINELVSSVQGEAKSNGMVVQVGRFSRGDTYFLAVTHVYANSPAAEAGIKRGDILISYNGADIDDSNYVEAYYGEKTATYGKAHAQPNEQGTGYTLVDEKVSVTLTPVDMYQDPILCYKVFEIAR